jgi:hypothetical protein
MSFDYYYWADNETGNKPATLEYLVSKLKDKDMGYIKERVTENGSVLDYLYGQIVLKARLPEEVAERLTILPKGIFKKTFEKNYNILKIIIESSGIKLTRIIS